MRNIFLLLGFLLPFMLSGQELEQVKLDGKIPAAYDKDLLAPAFHKGRREALRKLMADSTVAVFFSNPIMNRSNDVDFEFHQDPAFYYLTGLREPDAVLVVFKEKTLVDSQYVDEVIFVKEKDPKSELWNGKRLGVAGVVETLQIPHAYSTKQLNGLGINFSGKRQILTYNIRGDVKDNMTDKTDLPSLVKEFSVRASGTGVGMEPYALSDMMAILRQDKQPEELVLMRKAIEITCLAQMELMRALEPGMTEYQSEAIVEYFFKKHGAEHWGFPSILGGGENSCILHYTTNRKELMKNDLLVVDIGAEYHGYTADVTRTLPVNGKFSPEQRAIYNLVLEAQKAGIKASRAGNKFWDPHTAAMKVIQKGLLELGVISSPGEAMRYFMHGTSHYLGLDVHDAGQYGQLEPGQVITVEPGIYIPEDSPCDPKWWNIGVRIEDDILITSGDPENMSVMAPREAAEVEKLMLEPSLFNVVK